MDRFPSLVRCLVVGICVMAVLAGCAAAGLSQRPKASASVGASASPSASVLPSSPASVGPTPTPLPVTSELSINFESANPHNARGITDVFAPEDPGPWPVVVMFHGDPSMINRESLRPLAERLAGQGFVVFAPDWGRSGGAAYDALSFSEMGEADNAQSACAIAFARAKAPAYGGDPSTMIVFGHSGGGNQASIQGFARPTPTDGCLGGTEPSAIDAIVAWEADWILGPSFWDDVLADEPGFFDLITPWKHLGNRPDLPVHFVVSDDPGLGRGDGPWLDTRGDGQFRSRFEAVGALDDGYIGAGELQTMFARVLQELGNPVTYGVMPNSSHNYVSDEGWPVFLDAFRGAAAET